MKIFFKKCDELQLYVSERNILQSHEEQNYLSANNNRLSSARETEEF